MFEVFQKYLSEKTTLTDTELEMIQSVSFTKKLRKRQYLLQEGDAWKHYCFVAKGCLRIYRVDQKGVEHIMKFCIENWWAGDRESLLTGSPSQCNIDALEDSVLILFKKEDYDELRKKIPAFDDMVNTLIHRSYIASQNRIHSAISYTTEEKYQNFIEKYPDIFSRVPLHMIASYLGVSAETLSRIRTHAARR
ncbi:Crp/Fnr family transcriptional regulator [Chitinophaga tropicalis]|uniref:Cyclic nucleotide-binding domain-containing protein n=1 Tax=Chitinophaga tropicalis TaxID=2683588 RepID=A0A7K1UCI8_9BACT|nr:Crp/Fnr family transcriptional regulator [Chitinophaga tropicalis]MVT12026.1 cyclic nucleotide-binding domain-containing protein [Chitinophaga tropicalis]